VPSLVWLFQYKCYECAIIKKNHTTFFVNVRDYHYSDHDDAYDGF